MALRAVLLSNSAPRRLTGCQGSENVQEALEALKTRRQPQPDPVGWISGNELKGSIFQMLGVVGSRENVARAKCGPVFSFDQCEKSRFPHRGFSGSERKIWAVTVLGYLVRWPDQSRKGLCLFGIHTKIINGRTCSAGPCTSTSLNSAATAWSLISSLNAVLNTLGGNRAIP